MASTQNIERALRERFGSEETIITLAEILFFLKSYQNSCCAAGNPKNQQPTHGTQQNAPPPQGQARDQTRKERVTQQHNNDTAAKTQGSQSSAKPPEATEPRGPQNQRKVPETQSQGPQK